MEKENRFVFLAILILLFSSFCSFYVYATTSTSQLITINGAEYSIDQVFFLGEQKIVVSNDEQFSGVALDDLLLKVGVVDPSSHEYTIIGADGYQKTISWEHMKTGILTKERTSIFSTLPKAYRVKEVVQIEVK